MSTLLVDVLVIGGGATGAAALYDLARRGLRALLVEQLRSHHRHIRAVITACCIPADVMPCAIPKQPKSASQKIRSCAGSRPSPSRIRAGCSSPRPKTPPIFPTKWVKGCAAAGIPTEPITAEQARSGEPALTPRIAAVYRVPDAIGRLVRPDPRADRGGARPGQRCADLSPGHAT